MPEKRVARGAPKGFSSTMVAGGVTQPEPRREEAELEETLRPRTLEEFQGQRRVMTNLRTSLEAARGRGEPLDHCLFSGPPGLGKTTLAHIIARELGVDLRGTSGPALEKAGDLAGLLTNLKQGDILFIDEIHRLRPVVEEYLYPAMEDFALDILIDSGPNARSIHIPLNRFTLIGATTRQGLLTSPLRSRFGMVHRLDFYEPQELLSIVKRSARILQVSIDEEGAFEIARRARGTARVANRLLKWTRDFAQVNGAPRIDREVARTALAALQVDDAGLDEMDTRILRTLIEKFGGGPAGLNTLAVAVGEDPDTLEEVHEPFLIQKGFLQRTPRGREATSSGYAHLGAASAPRSHKAGQSDLF